MAEKKSSKETHHKQDWKKIGEQNIPSMRLEVKCLTSVIQWLEGVKCNYTVLSFLQYLGSGIIIFESRY